MAIAAELHKSSESCARNGEEKSEEDAGNREAVR